MPPFSPLQDRLQRLRRCGSFRAAASLHADGRREAADALLRFAAYGHYFISDTSPAPRAPEPVRPVGAPTLPLPAFAHWLGWLLRELVNLRLRPVFVAWREAEREGSTARAETLHGRFLTLLNFTDCYPFCVRVDPCGLWIMTREEADAESYWEDDYAA